MIQTSKSIFPISLFIYSKASNQLPKFDLLPAIVCTALNVINVKSGNTVSITGDGGNAWNYFGPAYKKLAPRLVTYTPYALAYEELLVIKDDETKVQEYLQKRREIEQAYIESYYETRLQDLDIEFLLKTLQEKFGNHIILLCHEEIDEFCHRRVLADYIEMKTDVSIPEVSVTKEGTITYHEPLHYHKQLEKVMTKK